MLANALPTIAWLSLVLGLCGHVLWLATDGRRADMPREIYDCMAGIVGQLFAGLLIIGLAIWLPEGLESALMLVCFFAVVTPFCSELPIRNDQPYYPMTVGWQMAARRFFLRSRLCMAAAATFGLLTAEESVVIWGLGAVAATNLSFYRAADADMKISWRLALPFLFPAFALVAALYLADDVRAGTDWLLADIQVHVLATIPGDDAATVVLLKTYLATILLLFLAAVVLDMGADVLRAGNQVRLLIRYGLTFVRSGTMIILLAMWQPEQPSASAWIICGILLLTELLVIFTRSPEPEVDPEPVQSDVVVVST